jgi:hypothetical protein
MVNRIAEVLENLAYPELRPYGRAERDRLLEKASDTQLDLIEWLGILVGLVIVAGVTRYAIPNMSAADRLAVMIVNFLVAVPLLAITVGPFLVRRKRRGLRSELQKGTRHR